MFRKLKQNLSEVEGFYLLVFWTLATCMALATWKLGGLWLIVIELANTGYPVLAEAKGKVLILTGLTVSGITGIYYGLRIPFRL